VVRHVTKRDPVDFCAKCDFFAFLNLFGVIILEIGGVQIFLPLSPFGGGFIVDLQKCPDVYVYI